MVIEFHTESQFLGEPFLVAFFYCCNKILEKQLKVGRKGFSWLTAAPSL